MTFNQIWSEIGSRSQLGETRSRYLYNLLKLAPEQGLICEIGVYQGITAKLMQLTRPNNALLLFDTFEGIQGADPNIDRHQNGDFASSEADVKQLMRHPEGGLVAIYKGLFPLSFPRGMSARQFNFVHSDTDTYHGTKSTLETLWHLMLPGAIMLFDDYANECCPGVEKALTEWSDSTGVEVLLSPDRWQAFVIKQ